MSGRSAFDLDWEGKKVIPQYKNGRWRQIIAQGGFNSATWQPGVELSFRFNDPTTIWHDPKRNHFRIRYSLTNSAAGAPALSNDIAPSMNLGANIIQAGEVLLQNKSLHQVPSPFYSQASTIHMRTSKSGQILNGLLGDMALMSPYQLERANRICSDGRSAPDVAQPGRIVLSRAALGLDAATNTIAVTVTTGVITIAAAGGQALPSGNIFQVGDIIQFAGAAAQQTTVLRVLTAATFIGTGIVALAATANNFTVSRLSQPMKQLSRVNIGLDAATNTATVTVATGAITLTATGGTDLPIVPVFQVGDIIQWTTTATASLITAVIQPSFAAAATYTGTSIIALVDAGAFVVYRSVYGQGQMVSAASVGLSAMTVASQQRYISEVMHQPPLGICDYDGFVPGGLGEWEYKITPDTAYLQKAVESLGVAKTSVTDYVFTVLDCKLWIWELDGEEIDKNKPRFHMFLNQVRVGKSAQSIPALGGVDQSINYTVENPSSNRLAFFFQPTSGFNSNTLNCQSKFVCSAGQAVNDELTVTKYNLRYKGMVQPSPDNDEKYPSGTNYFYQTYLNYLYATGCFAGNKDRVTPESFDEYLARGAIWMHSMQGIQGDMQKDVNLTITTTNVNAMYVLFAEWVQQHFVFELKGGLCYDVTKELV